MPDENLPAEIRATDTDLANDGRDDNTVDLVALVLTGLKPQSAEAYRKDFHAFARFLDDASPGHALSQLLRLPPGQANALALAYQADMNARKFAPATVARRLASLRRAARRARMVGIARLALETDAPKAEAFRDSRGPGADGWDRMLARARADAEGGEPRAVRDLAVLLLLHDRALRRGEVVGIDFPGDFDPGRPAVAVVGKGKSSRAWLTVNPRTRDALDRWVDVRGDWPGPMFTRADAAAGGGEGRTRLLGESVNRLVRAAALRAGLPHRVRAHGLRHGAITEALDAGWNVRDVKEFSRHGRIDTVLIYDDRRKDLGGQIARSLGPLRKPRKGAGK